MSNTNTLSIGDVANLRSGGPAMTVVGFEREDSTIADGPDLSSRGLGGLVRCIWFDEGARLQTYAFPHGLLDIAAEGPGAEEPHDNESLADKFRRKDQERQSAAARQDAQLRSPGTPANRLYQDGEQGQPPSSYQTAGEQGPSSAPRPYPDHANNERPNPNFPAS